jgi:hypothetical protein
VLADLVCARSCRTPTGTCPSSLIHFYIPHCKGLTFYIVILEYGDKKRLHTRDWLNDHTRQCINKIENSNDSKWKVVLNINSVVTFNKIKLKSVFIECGVKNTFGSFVYS